VSTPTHIEWDYQRLVAQEIRGLKDYAEMRKAPTLSAEAVVAFISQLSPWNLKTTGVAILEAYVKEQGKSQQPSNIRNTK
jgi:hypothetical protein